MPQVYRSIRPMFQTKQWRIFVDDIVKVVTGAEKGASGKVLAVIKDTKQPEVIIEGVNLRKRKIYTGLKEDDFFVVTMEAPLHYSNVQVVDPVSKKPVSTVFRFLPDGTRVRLGLGPNASKEVIPIPIQKEDTAKFGLCGAKDTPEAEVRRITYDPSSPFPFKTPRRPSGLPLPESLRPADAESPIALQPSTSKSSSDDVPAKAMESSGGKPSGRLYAGLRPKAIDPWQSPPWIGSPMLDSARPTGGLRPFSTLSEFMGIRSDILSHLNKSAGRCT